MDEQLLLKNAEEAKLKIQQDDIIITYGTDKDMMPSIEKAAGIITEEGGLTSHAAVVGLSLGIPVIVGVDKAIELINDGQDITIDAQKGDIYAGHASVL
ncbi:pyruvate kinase [Gracilibacillus boraciitolerans JCM 21714]|uniref:Pyruvate kinase n=1 Tax=Gracilibacillus boraciitolerans JCM 21714 TaxID=1298598 RepID=W4VIL7_9BACI|nr:pyruvate kinase [Gracilibacillus boraciitolerans JCM 21714]